MKQYNTRVAPSPTGFFHLGTARTAYHNWLAARASGGKFLLRIDDTDKSRNDDKYTKIIYQSLDWLGIDYDNTFCQSSRINHYYNIAQQLLNAGLAIKDNNAIRLKTNFQFNYWKDFYNNKIKVSQKDIQISNNQVILKSDGNPTYHFASVIDDVDYDINLIIRGSDHINNTAKQLTILNALRDINYDKSDNFIDFIHVGLIMKDGKKLSKRDNSSDIMAYNNYNPDALLNFILRLGWAHPNPDFDKICPLIDKDKGKQIFFDGKMKTVNSSFDSNKLKWLDKKYKNL